MKKLCFLSVIAGLIFALLALIPVVVKFVIFILMTCICLPIIIYLQRIGEIKLSGVNDCLINGALIGFISFICFSVVYIPLVYLLNSIIPISYLGGFVLMVKLSNWALMLMFILFISTVSVLFNAFFAFLWYCLCNRMVNNFVNLHKTFEQQLEENNNT